MDSMDDDFDLYADVEMQASSAIGVLYIEPEDSNPSNAAKGTGADEKSVPDSAMEDSDSEDDLNIVLNDDDCEKFPASGARSHGGGYEEDEECDFRVEGTGSDKASGRQESVGDGSELNCGGNGVERATGAKIGLNSQFSHFKYVRPHGSSFPSFSGRGDREDDAYSRKKGGSLVQVSNKHATANSLTHQFGYSFSLPWYRTILDVNIDAFEEKPWRHPGVDITDFFNFGFNEDSWKEYCKSLEKFRQQSSRQARIPVCYSSKVDLALEDESGRETITQEAMIENVAEVEPLFKCGDREMPLRLPKGRAIQVEESINERQPSMGLRCPRPRDSDVIIQITLRDSTVGSSDSTKEKLGHASKCEVSESRKLDAEDERDVHFSVSTSSDDLSGEHYARVRNVYTGSSLERSLQPTTASNQTSLETNNHRNDKLSDVNGGCHPNMDACILEGTAEAMETKDIGNEVACRDTHQSEPSVIETEPSLENRSHFSPMLSFSETYSQERSEDSVHAVSVEVPSPLRRQSLDYGAERQKSVSSCHKSSRSDDQGTKSDDGEGYLIHSSPIRDKKRHESWSHRHSAKQRILFESDDNISPISNADGYRKSYPRNRDPVEVQREHHHCRPRRITDRKMYPENCYEASPLSNACKLCDKDYSSVYCSRRKQRLLDLDYHEREGSSYYRDREPCVNGSKRYADSHFQPVCTKAHLRFKECSHQFIRKKWNGDEFYHDRRAGIDKEGDVDGYRGQRLSARQGLVPCRESGRLVSRYSSASEERDPQRRRGNGRLQLRNKNHCDDCPLDYNIENEWLKENYGRSISFTPCERDMVKSYERSLSPIRREVKVSGRKNRYVDSGYFHLDSSWPMASEDNYHSHTYGRSLALERDRDPSTPNGRRWRNTLLSRNEAYDTELTERYNSHERIACLEEGRDSSWFGYSDYDNDTEDNILPNNNQIQSWRRSHSKLSRVLHWREDNLPVNDRLFAQEVSFSCEKTSKHDLIHARRGSFQDELHVNDLMLQHHGTITEGSDAKCLKRNSILRFRGKHEQKVLMDRDSVDLIVGEGKSSGRHPDGRNLICNGRLEKLGLGFPMEQKYLRDFTDSGRGKALKTDILNRDGSRNSEKQPDKFFVTEYNQDLDIEEGQIICEGQSIEGINLEKVKMKTLHDGNASDVSRAVGQYGNKRIMETLAKMEKRRERFKDPITLKGEPDKTSEPQVESGVDTNEIKHQRPARKRRWCVS